uniref:ATP synthase F1 subunit epsilon n=1 Tax=Globodera pallida TaxID=36090 RepID=A0A183CH86_GLOPA
MSWQDLVNNNLIGTGHVSKAAICGLDGSIWGKSDNFKLDATEVTAAMNGLKQDLNLVPVPVFARDFGSMSRDRGEAALFQRPYSSKLFKREGGGRYSRGQPLMQGMREKRYQTMKSAENRRQQHTYPYTPVPDSMEHRDFSVSPDAVFNFHGYQSLFTLQHRFDFIVDGISYKSVDQFYQMHKVKDLTGLESAKFTDGSTRNYSALAKELLRQANVKRSNIDNWRTGRGVEVIQKALLEKVRQCCDLRSAITSTADKLIVHSYNGDDFFGTGVPAKYVKDWCSGMEQNKVSLKYPMEFPLTGDNVKYVPGKNVLGHPRMASQLGDLGGGSGKGGGSGGAVRDAGGALGKMEAAREEEYFNKLKQQQLKLLKLQLKREQDHHEEQAKHHHDVMERNKKRIQELEEESNST